MCGERFGKLFGPYQWEETYVLMDMQSDSTSFLIEEELLCVCSFLMVLLVLLFRSKSFGYVYEGGTVLS